KTSDFGQTWRSIVNNLPEFVHLHAVREDPKKKGMLYVGTERGVWFSTDDGNAWQPLKLNLPTVAVHDLIIKGDDLVVGTNGRSIWILDDLTPVREWTPQMGESELYFLPPVPTHRWRYHPPITSHGAAQNPPEGAILHYHLKSKPKGDLTIDIMDSLGKVV